MTFSRDIANRKQYLEFMEWLESTAGWDKLGVVPTN